MTGRGEPTPRIRSSVEITPFQWSNRWAILLCPVLLVSVTLGVQSILRQSATFDEPNHLVTGARFWLNGDYSHPTKHPPLAQWVLSAPVVLAGARMPGQDVQATKYPELRQDAEATKYPEHHQDGDATKYPEHHQDGDATKYNDTHAQFEMANQFFRESGFSPETLLALARSAILATGFGLLILIFLTTRQISGNLIASVFAASFSALSPTFLAHSTLATTDLFAATGYLLAFTCLWGFLNRPSPLSALGFGLGLGVCIGSKFSNLIAVPLLALIMFQDRDRLRSTVVWLSILAGFLLPIALSYQFVHLPQLVRDFELFSSFLSSGNGGHGAESSWVNYLWGETYRGSRLSYFPWVFVLKSTPAELGIFLSLSLAALKSRGKISVPSWLILAPLLFFTAACLSPLQIGHRHILAIYPFLWIGMGLWAARMWTQSAGAKIAVLALLLSQAYASLSCRPFFLSYFTELAGARMRLDPPLADSNVDWGQGLIDLRSFIKKENVRTIYLSYFGGIDPAVYGIDSIPVESITLLPLIKSNRHPSDERRTLFAISMNDKIGFYYEDSSRFRWLDTLKPVAFLGGSIFVYDITDQPEARQRLARYDSRQD